MNNPMKLIVSLTLLMIIPLFGSCDFKTGTPANQNTVNEILEKKYILKQLQEDYKQFQNIIESKHPKLYTNKEELSELFQTQYKLLKEGMGELDFYRILSPIAAKMNCGHTVLSVSEEYENYLNKEGSYLPFIIKVIDDRAYITRDISLSGIPEGAEVLSINGKPMKDIISVLLDNLPADGYNLSKKYYMINHWFNGFYNIYIDNAESFIIAYKKPESSDIIETRAAGKKDPGMNPTAENVYLNKYETSLYSKEFGEGFAVLQVRSFDLKEYSKYKVFIDEFFKELSDKKISNLILDLRDNWGGDPKFSAYLYSYLISRASALTTK